MHEESLVRSLLQQVERIAIEHQATRVTEVEVEIGALSGVEPLLVESAFARNAPGTTCDEAVLTVREINLAVACHRCSQTFELTQLQFACPACAASDVTVVRGEEFRLMNVTLET